MAVIALPAAAQSLWTGATSDSWFIGTNWNPVGPPGPLDEVILDIAVPNPTVVDGAAAGTILDLTVGDALHGDLTIVNAGSVDNEVGYVAREAGSVGHVVVSGAGSEWNNAGNLWVGLMGTGSLVVSAGGQVTSTGASAVGNNAGSTGQVVVTGAGSNWTNSVPSGAISIGAVGQGGMTIAAGGSVDNTIGTIAGSAGSLGDVEVHGVGSTWTNSGSLTVGGSGTGSMTVYDGGTVLSASGTVGNVGAAAVGTATIDGAGASWNVTGGLSVGAQGGEGTLEILDGASVQAATGILGHFGGTGTVIVDGGGSTWTLDELTVGNNDEGFLTIVDGGQVDVSGDAWVAREAGSSGTVSIGPGSALNVGGNYTQEAAGTYEVTIEPGGGNGLIAVAGGAALEGGSLVVSPAPGAYVPGTTYTILTATGGVTGSFSGLVVDGGGVALQLVQDATTVSLVVLEPASVTEIPTLSEVGLLLMGLVLALLGLARARRRGGLEVSQ